MDLISANQNANTLTLLTNSGTDKFVLSSTLSVGSQPLGSTAADVNGDGKVDLVSVNYGNNTFTVLTNNGNGGLALSSTLSVGTQPLSVTSADVNGDGKVDLISANQNANTLTVLTNNGSGGFVLASTLSVGSVSVSVVAADVNGDGKVDLVSANQSANTLSVLTNATPLPPQNCTPPPSGLVSWWSGEGNANDVAGTNNGILLNGAGFANGEVGQAFSFPGGVDGTAKPCVQIPFSPSLVVSNYTVETWIKPASQVNNSIDQSFIFGETYGIGQMVVQTGTTGVKVVFQFNNGLGGYPAVVSTNNIPIGQYSHVVGTWDGTTLRLYINGALNNQSVPGSVPMASGCEFVIGGTDHPASDGCQTVGQYFNGMIDEVSYYNRALALSEVQAIYTASGSGKCTANPPAIISQPTNQTVLAGGTAILSVIASGTQPLNYQWQNTNGFLIHETNATLTISNAQATNSDNYMVIVSNAYGSVTSAVATVTVVFPPAITLQPTNQTVAAGTGLTLAALASGTTPLTYQWQNSAGIIPGQTNSTLILNPVTTNHIDTYSVIVTNAYGVATSQVAAVFVYVPVSLLSQPASLAVPYLAPASFSVMATGFPAPTTYQWSQNGTNLDGANLNTFTISHVHLADTGNYQVQVSNGYSITNSYIATLNIAPTIVSPFSGVTAIWGKTVTLFVGATGSGQLNYQWYFNGLAIDGETGPTLNFTSIQFTNGGRYSVVVSSPFGSVTNLAAQVVVNPAGVALGFYPGLTITGAPGYSYIIQSSTDLTDTSSWVTLTNLTLTQPVQLWVDTNVDASSPFNNKNFYQILPGQ